ncbi:type II 3-dehydroquinate dehydratase [Ilumatobacter sp.]|uniref:type II 3-dehydroquinate dehydratase n=1 Tax=Ilumatobacter sp. TaxID=1967498 RepID=UPI003B5292F9
MAREILVLNGANLNLLGTREPEVYGADTLDDIVDELSRIAADSSYDVRAVQSNHEGELVDALHDAARRETAGVVLNPGAYTHTSIALRDAISGTGLAVVETHLSNVHARESFRQTSLISAVCLGVVVGFGRTSYRLALDALISHLDD